MPARCSVLALGCLAALLSGCHFARFTPSIVGPLAIAGGPEPRVALQVQTLTDPRGTPGPPRPLLLSLGASGPALVAAATPTDQALLDLLSLDPRQPSLPDWQRGPRLALGPTLLGVSREGLVEIPRPSGASRFSPHEPSAGRLVFAPGTACPTPRVATSTLQDVAACVSPGRTRLAAVRLVAHECKAQLQTAWLDADGRQPFADVFQPLTPVTGPHMATPGCAVQDDGTVLAFVGGVLATTSPVGAPPHVRELGVPASLTTLGGGGFAVLTTSRWPAHELELLDPALITTGRLPVARGDRDPVPSLTTDGVDALVLRPHLATLTVARVDRGGRSTERSIDLSGEAPPAIR